MEDKMSPVFIECPCLSLRSTSVALSSIVSNLIFVYAQAFLQSCTSCPFEQAIGFIWWQHPTVQCISVTVAVFFVPNSSSALSHFFLPFLHWGFSLVKAGFSGHETGTDQHIQEWHNRWSNSSNFEALSIGDLYSEESQLQLKFVIILPGIQGFPSSNTNSLPCPTYETVGNSSAWVLLFTCSYGTPPWHKEEESFPQQCWVSTIFPSSDGLLEILALQSEM